MAYGALAVESGLSKGFAMAMSVIVFGGASQVVITEQLANGVAGILIVLTAALVNLRHLLYSAAMAPHVQALPTRWRFLLGAVLTDEGYVASSLRFNESPPAPHRHWFFAGALAALWLCWQISTAIGVFAEAALPERLALEFALPLVFVAIVAPELRRWPMAAAALVAGTIAVAGKDWPNETGLFAAAVAGIAAGVVSERWWGAPAGELPDAEAGA
jgi:predicted branched-subunit amino acid permease